MASVFSDTIFALSSGRLPSGVAVVRLSGAHVSSVLERLTGSVPAPRLAKYARISASDGRLLDRGLALFFPSPHSFTGEDCAELHLHGSVATVTACLAELGGMPGLRAADAGEFTRRAFVNGKVDLTEAEGLADLIAAETEAQRVQALAIADGGQRRIYEDWRGRIVRARAMIEAEIDFADEDDVPGSVSQEIWPQMAELAAEIERHVKSARAGEIVRSGLDVIIIGPPNAGKSSLMNALARRDVSIITDEPGTTRDLVEVRLDIAGFRVNLVDTAGVRDNPGAVEAIGIGKAMTRAASADLVLLVEDVSSPGAAPRISGSAAMLRVGLKSDLGGASHAYDLALSVRTGAGIVDLLAAIGEFAKGAVAARSDAGPVRQRQAAELSRCRDGLLAACAGAVGGLELRAEDLRLAGDALSRLTGRIDVEDLLDVIFSQFCVGK